MLQANPTVVVTGSAETKGSCWKAWSIEMEDNNESCEPYGIEKRYGCQGAQ